MKQQKIWEKVSITAMASNGYGIGKHEGKVVFVEMAVPGDIVDVLVLNDKKNFAEGKIKYLHQQTESRTIPSCEHFGLCGGCKWQHINYSEQLAFKTQIVEDALIRIGKLPVVEVKPIVGCSEAYWYRNKLEFTFTDRRWLTEAEMVSGVTYDRRGVGYHLPGSYLTVLDINNCFLQADISNKIRIGLREFAKKNDLGFFDLKKQDGFLRNLIVRTSTTGELMVIVVVYVQDDEKILAVMNYLATAFPQITSLQYVVNGKRNNTIHDLPLQLYKGLPYITEILGDYRFKIHPKSFFQTNSKQAKVLYDIVKDLAQVQKTDVVYDLYTGVGSIGIYVSAQCARVVGIEEVIPAIEDAKENAALNGVENCHFYAGDVRMVLQPDFIAHNGKPDVVITDPPRAGMHEDVIKTLLELGAPKIVYVSCNPATQARDLSLLTAAYEVTKIQPVDMFPQTVHIENVALLVKKG